MEFENIEDKSGNINICNVILNKRIISILNRNNINLVKDLIKKYDNLNKINSISCCGIEEINESLKFFNEYSGKALFDILIDKKIEKIFEHDFDKKIICLYNQSVKATYVSEKCDVTPERIRQKLSEYKKKYKELDEDFNIFDSIKNKCQIFFDLEDTKKIFNIHNTELLYELLKLEFKKLYLKEENLIFVDEKVKALYEDKKDNTVKSNIERYKRNIRLRKDVLNNSNGICKLCDKEAPFNDLSGRPFLEVHHIKPLYEGGRDIINNMVAVCPNCHRKLHILNNKSDIEKISK